MQDSKLKLSRADEIILHAMGVTLDPVAASQQPASQPPPGALQAISDLNKQLDAKNTELRARMLSLKRSRSWWRRLAIVFLVTVGIAALAAAAARVGWEL